MGRVLTSKKKVTRYCCIHSARGDAAGVHLWEL